MTHNKKIKSSKNLNKWRKGDSCVSNPRNDRHRKLALQKRSALIELENKSLTVEAVKAHAIDLAIGEENTLRADDVASVDFRSNHSCKTFASNFTTQTIPAFSRFFERYTKTSVRHNRMLSIHSVLQERMQESNLPENSTTYLCGLMEFLETVTDEEDLDATLKLLSMVIKHANPAVLQEGYAPYSKILYDVFCANEESKYVLVNLFGCLSVLLRAQRIETWTDLSTKNVVKKILDHTISEHAKIRHSAQYNIASIMKGSTFMPDYRNEDENIPYVSHPMAESVGKYIFHMMRSSIQMKNAKTTLYLLVFLKLVISSLPSDILWEICQLFLQIIHLGDSVVKKCAMEVILALFKADVTSFNSDKMSCLVRALSVSSDKSKGLVLIPNVNDSSICGIWMSVVTHGVVRIVKLDQDLGFKILTSWFDQLVYCWNSDHTSIHDDVVENINILLETCIRPMESSMSMRQPEIQHIFSAINNGLSLQCQNAWKNVFRSISSAIQIIGPHLPRAITESVKKVSEFACDQHAFYHKCVEYTIGTAIEAIGVQPIMKILPLEITGNFTVDGKNLWILPVIRKHVKNGSLCFFEEYFAFLADKCQLIVRKLEGKNEALIFRYKTVILQLWSLFPPFAKHAVDQEQFLQKVNFCIRMRDLMKDNDDIRKEILLGIRNMVENCSAENPGRMAQYSKNFIPELFNLFLRKPKALAENASDIVMEKTPIDNSHRLVALSTAKLYLNITPKKLIDQFFNLVLKKISDTEADSFTRKYLIVLLREFIPYLSAENIQRTYDSIKQYLIKKNRKGKPTDKQKAAFSIIERIWQTKTEPCCEFANDNLWDILDMLKLTPRSNVLASRLNIMQLILENLPSTLSKKKKINFLTLLIDSGVQCCKRENCKRPRSSAYRLLFAVATAMEKLLQLSTKEMVIKFLSFLPHSGPDSLIGAKIDVTIVILLRYKEVVDDDIMNDAMKEVLDNLVKNSAIITASCLSFLSQVYRFWPIAFMSDFVEATVIQITNMNKHCREVKHRMTVRKVICRLLRKFGGDRIKAAIPDSNVIMKKVLKNLMTLEAQKTKERIKRDSEVNEEEYEDEITPSSGLAEILKELDLDDEDEVKDKMPKKILKNKLYIKEGGEDEVIDLLDPSSVFTKARKVRFVSSEKPTKSAEASFKIDELTGKFIIEEEGSAVKEKRDNSDHCLKMIGEDSLMDGKKRSLPTDGDDSDEELVNPTPKKKQKPTFTKNGKKQKTFGAQFKAKRAGGDVKKKEGLLPYAYLKLDRKMLNRRHQSKYSGQFKGIVKKGIRQAPRKISK